MPLSNNKDILKSDIETFLGVRLEDRKIHRIFKALGLRKKIEMLRFANCLFFLRQLDNLHENLSLFQWIGFISVMEGLCHLVNKRDSNKTDFINLSKLYMDIEDKKKIVLMFSFCKDGMADKHVCWNSARNFYIREDRGKASYEKLYTQNLIDAKDRCFVSYPEMCCAPYVRQIVDVQLIDKYFAKAMDCIYEMRSSTVHRGFPAFGANVGNGSRGETFFYDYVMGRFGREKLIIYASTNTDLDGSMINIQMILKKIFLHLLNNL